MSIQRKKKNKAGINLTVRKLEMLITEFLTIHAVDMVTDYQPESEQWRRQLSNAIAAYIIIKTR